MGTTRGQYTTRPTVRPAPERTDGAVMTAFHLAALNHGVFLAPRGLLALSTVLDDDLMSEAGERLTAAIADLAAAWPSP